MAESNDVRAHYDTLLAEHYGWMIGLPLAAKVAEQRALLEELGIGRPSGPARAFDLGCGPGYQSIALADLGFQVTAIDTSAALLAELEAQKGRSTIRTARADLLDYLSEAAPESADLIVCMGDTLTHLASRDQVRRLFVAVARALVPGGRLVITYRDLAETELTGLDRFIALRSDMSRIMTCFVEYTDAESVVVHDLIQVRDGETWQLRKSSYRKLRLPEAWLRHEFDQAGLTLCLNRPGRLTALVAEKPR